MAQMNCGRCDTLPSLIEGAKTLYFWPPLGHTLGKLAGIIKPFAPSRKIANGLSVDVKPQNFRSMMLVIDDELTSGEKTDTYCLVFGGDGEPTLTDFGNVTNLQEVVALYSADWLIDVLSANRLATYFQPIVYANKTNIPFAHECLLRWQTSDGRLSAPGELFAKAKDADMLFQLDRQARDVNIRNASSAAVKSKIFLNFTPTAIYDPENCLRSTFATIEEVGLSPDQVVFEVIETELVSDTDHLKSILDSYKAHGFKVALDDLGAGHSTLQLLGALRPDYVKLDMDMIRDVHKDTFKGELVKRIVSLAHEFDIQVIAEGIEVVEESAWLISQSVDYMQGYYFAKPGPDPIDVIERRQ